MPIISCKLDFKTLRKWETQVSKTPDPPIFIQLSELITERIDLLETLSVPHFSKSRTTENRSTSVHPTFIGKCAFCATTHFIICNLHPLSTLKHICN